MIIKRLTAWIFAFIPLIITLVVLPALPDRVPAHYGIGGDATRYGSKYEMLILPLMAIALFFLFIFLERITSKDKEKARQNQKVLYWIGIALSALLTALHCWILYAAHTGLGNLYEGEIDFLKIFAVCLGLFWVVIGNVLPKCKQNYIVGIRIIWTLRSELSWHKTHRFGGRLIFGFGILSVILSLIIPVSAVSLMITVLGFLVLIIPILMYSYIIYKQDTQK